MKITEVAAAVILQPDGRFLLGRRPAGTAYAGYWEFPGGKVEEGETPRQALVRELREEMGMEVSEAHPWLVREHVYEHAHVRLHFFRVSAWQGRLAQLQHDALSWQMPGEVTVAPLLPANAPILAALTLPDFYAISQAQELGVSTQLVRLEQALRRGLRLVQLREPSLPEGARRDLAQAMQALCARHGARLLINGDVALARSLGVAGVHLPARQLMELQQRPALPLVAASCHDAEELGQAMRLELDFVVLGPLKATASHPGEAGMGWPCFAALIQGCSLPVYALGGLQMTDLPQARSLGAQGIAALRAAWSEAAPATGAL